MTLRTATLAHPDDGRTAWRITIGESALAATSVVAPTFAGRM